LRYYHNCTSSLAPGLDDIPTAGGGTPTDASRIPRGLTSGLDLDRCRAALPGLCRGGGQLCGKRVSDVECHDHRFSSALLVVCGNPQSLLRLTVSARGP
jgi:hypothetical protein